MPRQHQPKRQKRGVFWGSLVGILVAYILVGFFSAPSAVALGVGVAWAGAEAWAEAWAKSKAKTEAVATVGALAGAVAVLVTIAEAWSVGVAGIVAGSVAWAVNMAGTRAAGALEKSFSKFHALMILLWTSLIGLGLGWLLYQIFPILE